MNENGNVPAELNVKSLFLVWGTPDQGPRSRVMAKELGMEVHFVSTRLPRGALYVPFRYPVQAFRTFVLLFRKRPKLIFVQSPPLLAVLCVYIYSILTGSKFVVDAHSDALLPQGWTAPPAWTKSFLTRSAVTTIVTNEHLKHEVEILGGHSLIIRDVPTTFEIKGEYPVDSEFNVAVINTFASDEPLGEVLRAAEQLPGFHFYITGRIGHRNSPLVDGAPANAKFMDFLPDDDYYGLLNTVQAVMCLTTRDHTMQRGACEALSLGKPIITSDWPILRRYFRKGTVHVDNTAKGIREGVLYLREHYQSFEIGIKQLQSDQQHEWQEKITTLASLLE